MSSRHKVSIIIPTYNGFHILEENLPGLYHLVKKELPETEIIIVDDCSSDNTVDQLTKLGIDLKILSNSKKSSFADTCNNGAKHANGDILFFLNNDMQVQDCLLPPLLSHFENDAIFAVAPSSLIDNGSGLMDEIPTVGIWKKGFLYIQQFEEAQASYNKNLFHASGGSLCVRSDRFHELDGFDTMFSPFFFEDIDLCWRAKKQGWEIIHEPEVKLLHKSHATIDHYYSKNESETIYWKNYFLFIWKNITDENLFKEHADHLVKNLFYYARHGHTILSGFKMALRLFSSERTCLESCNVPDKQLLQILN